MNEIDFLKKLNVSSRDIDIFCFRHFENFTFQAIANVYGISRQAVFNIYKRICKLLYSPSAKFRASMCDNSWVLGKGNIKVASLFLKEKTFNALTRAGIDFLPSFNIILANAEKFLSIKSLGNVGLIDILRTVYSYEQGL